LFSFPANLYLYKSTLVFSTSRYSALIISGREKRGSMQRSRRDFLAQMTASVLGAAIAPEVVAQQQQPTPSAKPTEPPAGTPPAIGTAPPVGPEVSPATFAEAEKLARVELTEAERAEAAGNWRMAMAPLYERR